MVFNCLKHIWIFLTKNQYFGTVPPLIVSFANPRFVFLKESQRADTLYQKSIPNVLATIQDTTDLLYHYRI